MKTLQSLTLVLAAPVLLSYMFSVNVIKTDTNRSPAVEKEAKSVKKAVKNYLLAVNKVQ